MIFGRFYLKYQTGPIGAFYPAGQVQREIQVRCHFLSKMTQSWREQRQEAVKL